MATLIDGKALAAQHRKETAEEVQKLKAKGLQPGLAFIVVGLHPASQIYVKNKAKACDEVGIENFTSRLSETISEEDLQALIEALNKDPKVHGILVQLPLPQHFNTNNILFHIDPKKDVDGLHPDNMGRLFLKLPGLKPCTPQGIIYMIESTGISLRGKDACVVGRSAIVGKPTAALLEQKDCTVTLCHSQTKNLAEKIRSADIVVAAIGKPRFIQGSWIKKGAIVIDVGIHRISDGNIIGDVDFDEAKNQAGYISPVPGGVGPMTIAMLLRNTVQACKNNQEKK
ncbi:MAG: bifunctional methylenetetrahydrofolate dehydrogenase/methenyltetrahydrofolate cyclohydrolase [Deltaproteobacteria bacterium RIFCSPLOWO2_02_FULL_46_8]|nr:MAG: bifunctional methylenetetrahydrofolate dehydrogenase/methenyltetrahydrofolate cyclohydrolase [Deltaproteobacteria bacterium RIFCSPLOWO2_02_FULL_46_8]